jgi:hypothetical protein
MIGMLADELAPGPLASPGYWRQAVAAGGPCGWSGGNAGSRA